MEVISQGANIIYIESATVAFSPDNGENNAVLTITGLQAADLVTVSSRPVTLALATARRDVTYFFI